MNLRISMTLLTVLLVWSCGSSSTEEVDRPMEESATPTVSDSQGEPSVTIDAEKKIPLSPELDDALLTLTKEKDFSKLLSVPSQCAEHLDAVLPHLINLLTVEKFVGLKNTADLIIFERIASGDLQSYGHGGVVDDDLFCVSGRASWLLKELTKEDLGVVKMKSSPADKKLLQSKWKKFAGSRIR